MNLSMTECFFSNQYAHRADLFEGLSIWKEERFRELQGTWPVIFLSLAKVLDRDEGERTLEDTVARALDQIEEKQYEAELLASGIPSENIRKYGFAFEGKKCLIGCRDS